VNNIPWINSRVSPVSPEALEQLQKVLIKETKTALDVRVCAITYPFEGYRIQIGRKKETDIIGFSKERLEILSKTIDNPPKT